MTDVLTYRMGSQTPGDLQRIIDGLLASIPGDAELAAEIREQNADPATLRAGVITVEPSGAGLDPATVALIVAFAAPPVLDVWKHVLLPRIRRRWGIKTVGPEIEGDTGRD